MRYAGSPLKYSFSESGHQKSVSIVQLQEKGTLSVREIPLHPMREMAELKGTYDTVTMRDFYEAAGHKDDYLHITLLDETDVPDAAARLRVIYPNLMKLDYENRHTVYDSGILREEPAVPRSPLELFSDFFVRQTGKELGEKQRTFMEGLLEQMEEGCQ